MKELIIYVLLIAGAYYFLTHQQEEVENKPLTSTHSTQTEPIINEDENLLESTLDQLIKNIRQLNREIK
jgi:hypothetical protein